MAGLRTGRPLVLDGLTLVPVERCSLKTGCGDTGCWLSWHKEPFAVIVCRPDGMEAFDAGATKIPVAWLVEQVPDLGDVLSGL